MPLLEQRREPPPAAAARGPGSRLRLSRRAVRGWPLLWSVLHLAAFLGGGRLGQHRPAPDLLAIPEAPRTLVRLAAALPVLLVVPGAGLPVGLATVVLSGAAGWGESTVRNARVAAEADSRWSAARPRTWEGPLLLRITGWPTAGSHATWRVPARLVRAGPGQGAFDPRRGEGVLLSGKDPAPTVGSLVAGRVRLRVPDRSRIPGGFDDRRFLAGRSLDHRARVQTWRRESSGLEEGIAGLGLAGLRRGILNRLAAILPPREAALAGAVLLGVRGPDHRTAGASFTALGLAHLFAVSGLHVGILLGLFTLPGRLAAAGPAARFLPLLVILPLYALLTGLPGSVVRAVGLALLGLAGPVAGARVEPLRILGLLFWAGCVWEPRQVLDTGLQLSYLAAGGILAVSGSTDGFRFAVPGWLRWPAAGIGVSVAAQWFTLPVVAASFGRISLVSPLANLVAVPVFGIGVWLTAVAVLLGSVLPVLGAQPAAWAWLVFRGLAGLVAVLDEISGGVPLGLPAPGVVAVAVWVLLSGTGLALLRLRSHPRLRVPGRPALALVLILVAGLAVAGPAFRSLDRGGVTLWTFDVGQGDATLVRLPDGWTVLVDLGGVLGRPGTGAPTHFGRTVHPWLVREGVRSIDAAVLTHGHLDHTAGARDLLDGFRVRHWYCGGRAHRAVDDSSAVLIRPRPGRHLIHRSGPWRVLLLVPDPPDGPDGNENDRSLVTVLAREHRTVAVLSGDLEREGEARLLARGMVPRGTTVWKAGHHGSATSGSPDFLATLDPDLVLVSCGVGNRYGHPSHGPYVAAAGDTLPVLRTDLDGSIRLRWTGDGGFAGAGTSLGRVP